VSQGGSAAGIFASVFSALYFHKNERIVASIHGILDLGTQVTHSAGDIH
jgi:hypothetical protein